MPTIVRIEDKLIEWTQQGWKTDNFRLELLCRMYMESGAGGYHWDRNPQKAEAEKLVAAFKEDGFDAEIISIVPM
jgi:hypothetical protein